MHKMKKLIVGHLEVCALPEIGIKDLQIRVDTGAKTSSLHVDNLNLFKKKGKPWIKFDIHPNVHNVDEVIQCQSALHSVRKVKSSNGISEERFVIKTLFKLSDQSWPIQITLTDRSDMSYLMLLGRQGMRGRILVDPSKTFLIESLDDKEE